MSLIRTRMRVIHTCPHLVTSAREPLTYSYSECVQVRRTLPEWIQTPRSAVVPFGVFEKVLADCEYIMRLRVCVYTHIHTCIFMHA